MKKQYEAPVAEKIEFCYRNQVVASSCIPVATHWDTDYDKDCDQDNNHTGEQNN